MSLQSLIFLAMDLAHHGLLDDEPTENARAYGAFEALQGIPGPLPEDHVRFYLSEWNVREDRRFELPPATGWHHGEGDQ